MAVPTLVVGADTVAMRGIVGVVEAVLAGVGRRGRGRLAATYRIAISVLIGVVEACLARIDRRRSTGLEAGLESFAERGAAVIATGLETLAERRVSRTMAVTALIFDANAIAVRRIVGIVEAVLTRVDRRRRGRLVTRFATQLECLLGHRFANVFGLTRRDAGVELGVGGHLAVIAWVRGRRRHVDAEIDAGFEAGMEELAAVGGAGFDAFAEGRIGGPVAVLALTVGTDAIASSRIIVSVVEAALTRVDRRGRLRPAAIGAGFDRFAEHRATVDILLAGLEAGEEGFVGVAVAVAAGSITANTIAVGGIVGTVEAVVTRARRRRGRLGHAGVGTGLDGRGQQLAAVDSGVGVFEAGAESFASVGGAVGAFPLTVGRTVADDGAALGIVGGVEASFTWRRRLGPISADFDTGRRAVRDHRTAVHIFVAGLEASVELGLEFPAAFATRARRGRLTDNGADRGIAHDLAADRARIRRRRRRRRAYVAATLERFGELSVAVDVGLSRLDAGAKFRACGPMTVGAFVVTGWRRLADGRALLRIGGLFEADFTGIAGRRRRGQLAALLETGPQGGVEPGRAVHLGIGGFDAGAEGGLGIDAAGLAAIARNGRIAIFAVGTLVAAGPVAIAEVGRSPRVHIGSVFVLTNVLVHVERTSGEQASGECKRYELRKMAHGGLLPRVCGVRTAPTGAPSGCICGHHRQSFRKSVGLCKKRLAAKLGDTE